MASHPVLLLLLTTMGSVLAASVAQAPAPAPVDNVLRPTVPSCSTTGNYTAGDQYQKNLADLLATMPAAAINNSWFYAGSAGTGADQVHGLIVCYADRNATQCEDCLTRGPAGIASSVCPGSRRVNAAYDACVLRYADEPVSGEADNDVAFYVYEATGADVDDSFALDVARSDLMDELARKAAAAEMRVANGSAPCAGAAEDVYGMAQCTRDLASEQCASCLEEYVEKIGEVFGDWTGGAIKGYSCYVRPVKMEQLDETYLTCMSSGHFRGLGVRVVRANCLVRPGAVTNL
ncbi:hypothetical protein PR202_gb24213 [Eleusine coracana subsp. coracana]|uniref:Gnk2-homologous domain-containing protein n=1 Tax=Eleusine coracana subsp. coracana TaxID=191504 RepID=A0AAV5FKY7_ELECO|nr:hypothetical protein PR202_gb24213 [Eleusine coracana subsp. coracana]